MREGKSSHEIVNTMWMFVSTNHDREKGIYFRCLNLLCLKTYSLTRRLEIKLFTSRSVLPRRTLKKAHNFSLPVRS